MRVVMEVAVGDVRIDWARRVAAAAEAGPASVRSVRDYLVCSLSRFIRTGRGEEEPDVRAGRSRAWDGVIQ